MRSEFEEFEVLEQVLGLSEVQLDFCVDAFVRLGIPAKILQLDFVDDIDTFVLPVPKTGRLASICGGSRL